MSCIKASGPLSENQLKSLLVDRGTMFSSLGQRPNSKFHTVIMTKRHTEFRTMTDQEWADALPVLKETINKIENLYKFKGKAGPLGYRISIPCGEKAGANQPPHFYMRVVPKYKKDWGTVSTSREYKPVSPEKKKELEKIFQPNQDNVIVEKEKVFAKLHNETALGYTLISTKSRLPADIQAMDEETWKQLGEILKDCMRKFESSDIAHDFNISFSLGEAGKVFESEKENKPYTSSGSNELKIVLFPKLVMGRWWRPDESRPKIKGQMAGTMENERYAEMLRDPEAYTKIWGKKTEVATLRNKNLLAETSQRERESLWKQPSTYLLVASGVGICLLGMGIYWWLSRRAKVKS